MAAKLESIIKKIHWSLAAKAAVTAGIWLFLPWWVFALTLGYFYFSSFFQVATLAWPLWTLIFLSAVAPGGFLSALGLGAGVYLLLGLKDLIFIERREVYYIIVLLLLFFMLLHFFLRAASWQSPWVFAESFLVFTLFLFLSRDLIAYQLDNNEVVALPAAERIHRQTALVLSAFLLWQISIAVLFLPLNFLYQTALMFLCVVVALEFLHDYLRGRLTRPKLLVMFSVFLVLLVITLVSARWS